MNFHWGISLNEILSLLGLEFKANPGGRNHRLGRRVCPPLARGQLGVGPLYAKNLVKT